MSKLKREVRDIERFKDIAETVARHGFSMVFKRTGLDRFIPFRHRVHGEEVSGPEEFREMFEDLGPVFIKFGQMLAERKDIIPEEYADELKRLEDSVREIPVEEAKEVVDEEVGLEAFSEFEDEPIASASIAQVHRARLESGEEVVVKVRRPGIEERVETDLDVLTYLAKKADQEVSLNHSQLQRDVEQFAEWTRKEIDLRKEAKNARKIKDEMEGWEKIYVPETYGDLSTEKVLVQEYVDAVRFDAVEELEERGVDLAELSREGVRSQLHQIFRHGFFHADPHPSNFMVDGEGRLVYVDFGIVGRLTKQKRRDVLLMMYGMVEGDVEGVVDSMESLSYVEDDSDREGLRREVERTVKRLMDSSIEEASVAREFARLSLESARHGYYMPNDLMVMGKGMATVEGIGMQVYPEYSFTEDNREFLEKLVKEQFDPAESAKEFAADLLRNREALTKMPSKINRSLEENNPEVDVNVQQSSGRPYVAASLVLASAYLASRYLDPSEAILAAAGSLAAAYILLKQ